MIITQRDKDLFQKLLSYAVMTTRQIAQAVFQDIQLTTVLRRLRKLEKHNFIKRNVGLSSYEHAWTLTENGAKLVSDRPPKWHQSRFLLEHDTKLTALRMSLESIGVAQSWVPEHEIRFTVASKYGLDHAKEKLIPDGLLGIDWQGVKESIAVEVELHSKSSRRYRRNFYDYSHKQNIFGVWYLTSTPTLGRHIEKIWIKEVGERKKPYFFWSLIDEVIDKPMDAIVFHGAKSKPVYKLWGPKFPAQTSAHPLSKQSLRSSAHSAQLTTDNLGVISTPAS